MRFSSRVAQAGDRFFVTAYAPDQVFGCYDRRNHEEITYEVTRSGRITEMSRRAVYAEYLPGMICVD